MKGRLKQSQEKKYDTLFLLYESAHVEELVSFWHKNPKENDGSLVVALSLDVEARLTERGIIFSSGREYKQPFPNLLATEDKMMANFFADERWSIFDYRGVMLPTTFRFMFRLYLQRAHYYANLLTSVVEAHPHTKRLVIFAPSSGFVPEVAGSLAGREIEAVIDCVKIIAARCNLSVEVIPQSLPRRTIYYLWRPFFFKMKRTLFSFFLKLWNVAIAILINSRTPRLIISDYWRHVGSAVKLVPEGECIFLDRMELRNINWRTLLRYRMRFVHGMDFLSRRKRKGLKKQAQEFSEAWRDMRGNLPPVFRCRGYSFDALLLGAIDDIVNNFEKILGEIEGTYLMYEYFRPDAVLLRASVSGQTHFSVLPLVARQLNIPSVELQHGLEYLGPGSLSREHEAEYIAVYGPLVKRELLSLGYNADKVREIGSPRFDNHEAAIMNDKNSSGRFTILCVAPDIRPFEIYDSYGVQDYFRAVARTAKALKSPHVIIKLRSSPAGEGLFRTIITDAFSQVSHNIVKDEILPSLFKQADVVVSGYSTVILEALQCGMSVIIPALNPIDASTADFHFSQYEKEGALCIARSNKEFAHFLTKLNSDQSFRAQMKTRARAFMVRHFCFDGNSSRRFATLIQKLSQTS